MTKVKGWTRARGWAAAALACLLLAACDGGGGTTNTESLDVDALLDRAVTRFMELTSFHFYHDFDGETAPIVQFDLDMERVEGDVVVPDQLRASVLAKVGQLGGINVNVTVVAIADEAWITNPFDTSQWLPMEGGNPIGDIFDPVEGIATVIRSVVDPRVTGEEQIEGIATWRIEGLLDSGDLDAFALSAIAGYEVRGMIWIGQEDDLIHRMRLEGRLQPDEPEGIVRRVDLSEFDQPITIEPPP